MVPDRGIFVVADGMGGHAAGEVASEMAVRFVARELGSLKGLSDDQVADRMRAAIRSANGAIFQRTLTEHDKRGMGTTVTSMVLYDTRFLIGQVGDSRAYLFRDGKLIQLTKDHSYVQEQVDAGYLTPEQARSHPYSNVITRCVGANSDVMPDIYLGTVKLGDLFLLASDGLTGMLEDPELAGMLGGGAMPQDRGDTRETDVGDGDVTSEVRHRAVPSYERHVEGEHRGLRREVEEYFSRGESQLAGQPVFDALDQIRVIGGPGRRVGRQVRAGDVEGPLGEPALAQPQREAGRIVVHQLVDQPVVRGGRDALGIHPAGGDCPPHQALEHRRRAPHGMVPIDIAVHLILREEQRLERRDALFVQGEGRLSARSRRDGERGEQAIDVDHTVWHTAHPGVARQIVELVHVERSRDEAGERLPRAALNQREQAVAGSTEIDQSLREGAVGEVRARQGLVMRQAGFLERMGKRVVPDVVQQRGELQPHPL